jgi:hypothetical protein
MHDGESGADHGERYNRDGNVAQRHEAGDVAEFARRLLHVYLQFVCTEPPTGVEVQFTGVFMTIGGGGGVAKSAPLAFMSACDMRAWFCCCWAATAVVNSDCRRDMTIL